MKFLGLEIFSDHFMMISVEEVGHEYLWKWKIWSVGKEANPSKKNLK